MGEEISKEAVVVGHAAKILLRRELPGYSEEICLPTAKNDCNEVRRNLLHTGNTTGKDTTKTTATPAPLPAGGQAPALLQDRKLGVIADAEQLTHSFGRGVRRRRGPKLGEAEWENRRQTQRRALLASGAVNE